MEVAKPWGFSDTRRGKTISGNNHRVQSAKADTFPQCGTRFNFKQMQRTQKSSDPGLSILPVRARHGCTDCEGGGQLLLYVLYKRGRHVRLGMTTCRGQSLKDGKKKKGEERSVTESRSPALEWHGSKLTSLLHNSWYYITKCL